MNIQEVITLWHSHWQIKYISETEEGRRTIVHELTHVAQYAENRINKNSDKIELEKEAENNENLVVYDPDPVITKKIDRKEYSFRKSVWHKMSITAMRNFYEWVELQGRLLNEKDYLELLLKVQKWENDEKSKWEW